MDKIDAIKLAERFIEKVRESGLTVSEALLFGSYAKGLQTEYSDIDLAIVLGPGVAHSFDIDVQLMVLRMGDEIDIEPHAFSQDEFSEDIPLVNQIISHGIRISAQAS